MFSANGTAIADAIGKLGRIIPKSTEAVFVSSITPTVLQLQAFYENKFAAFRIDATNNKKFSFVVAGDRLKAICNKRSLMSFSRKGKTLEYKEKNYSGRIELAEIEVEFPSVNYQEVNGRISDILKSVLLSTCTDARLKSLYEGKDHFFFIKISKSGAKVVSGDRVHTSLCVNESFISKNEIDFVIPASHFQILTNNFDLKKHDVNIKTESGHIHFYNNNCTISLPVVLPNDDDGSLDLIEKAFIDLSNKKPLFQGQLNTESLNHVISNMEAIKEKDVGLKVKLKFANGVVRIKAETRHGSMRDTISMDSAKNEAEITLESTGLQDILSKIKGNAVVSILEGNICRLENQNLKEKKHNQYILLGLVD